MVSVTSSSFNRISLCGIIFSPLHLYSADCKGCAPWRPLSGIVPSFLWGNSVFLSAVSKKWVLEIKGRFRINEMGGTAPPGGVWLGEKFVCIFLTQMGGENFYTWLRNFKVCENNQYIKDTFDLDASQRGVPKILDALPRGGRQKFWTIFSNSYEK